MMSTTLHRPRTWVAPLVLLLSIGVCHTAFSQGSLTPPGAPAPTMKTLDQVEPRTAITSVPFAISQGGSYYLTKSFEQSFGNDAITILTNNVTLDLCGFTLNNTGTNFVTGVSIAANGGTLSISNVIVRNGIITGFAHGFGVEVFGGHNCTFEDLTVTMCSKGIEFQTGGSPGTVGNLVRNCRACNNSGTGIDLNINVGTDTANVIDHCEALNNTALGILLHGTSNIIVNCRAAGNGINGTSNYSIGPGNRMGLLVLPATNSATVVGSSGGTGTGTTDPFANISY